MEEKKFEIIDTQIKDISLEMEAFARIDETKLKGASSKITQSKDKMLNRPQGRKTNHRTHEHK